MCGPVPIRAEAPPAERDLMRSRAWGGADPAMVIALNEIVRSADVHCARWAR